MMVNSVRGLPTATVPPFGTTDLEHAFQKEFLAFYFYEYLQTVYGILACHLRESVQAEVAVFCFSNRDRYPFVFNTGLCR